MLSVAGTGSVWHTSGHPSGSRPAALPPASLCGRIAEITHRVCIVGVGDVKES